MQGICAKGINRLYGHENNGEIFPSVLWDAAKSVIRGKLIAFTSHGKKERNKKLSDMQGKLRTIDMEHAEKESLA